MVYYTDGNKCQNILNNYYNHRDKYLLVQEFKAEFPFDDKDLRKKTWTVLEATLIYYGLNAKKILSAYNSVTGYLNLEANLTNAIDNENLYDLLLDYLGEEICPVNNCVAVDKFTPFLISKNIPIPLHFPTPLAEVNEDNLGFQKIEDGEIKKLIKAYDLKRFSPQQLGMMQARIVAAALWKNDKTLSQTDILDDNDFKNHMKNFFDLCGIDNEKEMRAEWIFDLDPRTEKVGRPKKP